MDREGGQGGSALAIQISQAGWTAVIYLSYPSAVTIVCSCVVVLMVPSQ